MTKTQTLDLAQLFGQRERPSVKLREGEVYELRLPDELDPRDQVKMLRLARKVDAQLETLPEDPDSDTGAVEEAVNGICGLLELQLGVLNPDLAKRGLSFIEMRTILNFYKEATSPKAPEKEGESPQSP